MFYRLPFILLHWRIFRQYMQDIGNQIMRLEELTRELVSVHERIKIRNRQLEEKVAELEGELRKKNSELALMERELKTARIASGMAKGGDEAELARAKIGSLVREIDRCIALLNE